MGLSVKPTRALRCVLRQRQGAARLARRYGSPEVRSHAEIVRKNNHEIRLRPADASLHVCAAMNFVALEGVLSTDAGLAAIDMLR